jgi:predicted outer membrane protein
MHLMALLLSVPFAGVAVAQDTTKSQDPYRTQNPMQQNQNDSSRWQGRGGPMNDEMLLSRLHAANQKEIQMGQLAQRNASSTRAKQLAQRLVRDHQQADQRVTQLAKRLNITLQNPDSMGRMGMGHDGMRGNRDTTDRQGQYGVPRDTTMRRDTTGNQSSTRQGNEYGNMKQDPMQGDQDQDQDKDAHQRLQSLRGAAFDTAFARLMVRSHERNIAMLERVVGQKTTPSSTSSNQPYQGRDTSSQSGTPQTQNQQQDQNSQMSPSQGQFQGQAQISSEVRTLVTNLLPTLREHRRLAQQLVTGNTNTSSLQ